MTFRGVAVGRVSSLRHRRVCFWGTKCGPKRLPRAFFSKQGDPVASFRPRVQERTAAWGRRHRPWDSAPLCCRGGQPGPERPLSIHEQPRVRLRKPLTFCHSRCKRLSLQPATSANPLLFPSPAGPAVLLGHCFFSFVFISYLTLPNSKLLRSTRDRRAPNGPAV